MIEVCAQLGNKLNNVEGELRFLSRQLQLLQAFVQNKFEGEFEEFVEATEQADVSGCSVLGNDDTPQVPEASGRSSPNLAENEEPNGVQRNEDTNSSTKNTVVTPAESVGSVTAVPSSTIESLLSSPTRSVFTSAQNAESYFFSAETNENAELQDLLFWNSPEKDVNEDEEDSEVDVETVLETPIQSHQPEELERKFHSKVAPKIDVVCDSLDPQMSTADSNSPAGKKSRGTIPYPSPSSISCRIRKKKLEVWERSKRLCPKKVRIPVKRLPDATQQKQTSKRDADESQPSDSSVENEDKSDDEDSVDASHSDSQSAESDSEATPLQTQKTRLTKFQCPICKKTYNTLGNLKQHKKTHNPCSFTCPLCLKSFLLSSQLRQHYRIHKKPLSCYLCSKTFRHASALRAHERNQKIHRINRYTCPVCLKGFRWASHLQKHKQIHRYE